MYLLGVLERDDDRRGAGIEADLARRHAGVGEQAPLEIWIGPGTRHETRAVSRRAGDEPVDAPTDVFALEHALLDEEVLERSNARCGRGLTCGRHGLVRMIVIVVVVAHSAASSQCSKTSARTRSPP